MSGTPGRLLALLSLLQARRDWPGAVLAERLEVSARTVRRDVDRLRELGYPVRATTGPDGGYRLEAGAHVPPLLFNDEQAVALAVALQRVTVGGADTSDAAVRALATVRQVLPARLRAQVDAVHVTAMTPPGGAGAAVDPAVLLAVAAAARDRQVLRFGYGTSPVDEDPDVREPRPPRRVEPHHVLARAGRLYLLCWDLDADAWRTFRLDRMRPRVPVGPRFVPRPVPGGDPAAFVAASFRGADEPGRDGGWPCRGEVVLHAPAAAVAPFVEDGVVEPLDDDRCRLLVGSWSWPALAASLLRYDVDVEVLAPPELAGAFADLAGRCARAAKLA
ncbi:helix-turn-helix transcriptional regulator [Cellulomonas marina]|uniref:Predicted DNA-binding transcriptional regulator YafY, contains an HTH and WYL domains n=1 Tax=Cellulomonas marina TaxID=988821 RepID=A0A1I0XA79_9CELL|nr:WYL domain-containing protein [Cellulomonas marina]GIG29529.1 DeoR family transcriptional regulator [Cellulomonas marina]SFA97577.1 Predicted DNA-binding transcriptional regulator YafY, contains an HTH and WYL domains [Cellulomonas marina]